VRNIAAALKPEGLLVIEPWIGPEKYHAGTAHMSSYEDDELKLCRQVVSRAEAEVAILEMHWLVARKGF
jgi:hypothetical protein